MLDDSIKFLRQFAASISHTTGGKGKARRHSLTSETKNALVNSLHGLVYLCNDLLSNPAFKYILLSELQTDPLEAEFGVYRQMSGGVYYISVEQVLLSARLRRMKMYAILELAEFTEHRGVCCSTPLSDDELSSVDKCPLHEENLSSTERASLYYIAGKLSGLTSSLSGIVLLLLLIGYISHKEGILAENTSGFSEDSEFTDMVSRGKLTHPPAWLFQFSCLCYSCFTLLQSPQCASRIESLFQTILEYFMPDILENLNRVITRLTNCFLKGFVRKESQSDIPVTKNLEERKLAKHRSLTP